MTELAITMIMSTIIHDNSTFLVFACEEHLCSEFSFFSHLYAFLLFFNSQGRLKFKPINFLFVY